jgi:hypothetical protein
VFIWGTYRVFTGTAGRHHAFGVEGTPNLPFIRPSIRTLPRAEQQLEDLRSGCRAGSHAREFSVLIPSEPKLYSNFDAFSAQISLRNLRKLDASLENAPDHDPIGRNRITISSLC